MSQPSDNRVSKPQLEAALAQLREDLKPVIQEAVQDIRQRRAQQIEQMRREVLMRGLRQLFPRSM